MKAKAKHLCWYCGRPAARLTDKIPGEEPHWICDDTPGCLDYMIAHDNTPWTLQADKGDA